MSLSHASFSVLDSKTRRKLQDIRRMRFRRAIETYSEYRRLQQELLDYPELTPLQAYASLFLKSAPPAR